MATEKIDKPKKTKAPRKTAKPKKPKIAVVPIDGPLPTSPSAIDTHPMFGPIGGIRIVASGRSIAAVGERWPYKLGWHDPGRPAPTIADGLDVAHGAPLASPGGTHVMIDDKAKKAFVEIALHDASCRVAYEYGHNASFIKGDYVNDDTFTFLWGANELWTLHRQPDGSYEPGEVVHVKGAYSVRPFLGRFALLGPESGKTTHIVVGFRGTNIEQLASVTLDRDELEVRDGRPIVRKDGTAHAIEGLDEAWSALAERPALRVSAYDGHLPVTDYVLDKPERYKTVFTEARSLFGVTPQGRILGWVERGTEASDPWLVWLDLDDSRHDATPGSGLLGPVHPSQERMIVYQQTRPVDVAFPPRSRVLADLEGARAAYASDRAIAILAGGELSLIADDDSLTELARVPCPDHDDVFVLAYGSCIVTAGPIDGKAAPRVYDVANGLTLRGELQASAASKRYAAAFRDAGKVISGVAAAVFTYGRYFLKTHRVGTFEVHGV